MSDLGGGGSGRAHNGGARSGPIPSGSGGGSGGGGNFAAPPAPVRTPRQIMNERNAREARRQQEEQMKAEEQRRMMENRRTSVERRSAAMVPGAGAAGAAPRISNTSSRYSTDEPPAQFDGSSGPGRGRVAGSGVLGEPTGRASVDYSSARPRGPTISQQQDQPRGAAVPPSSAAGSRRAQTAPGGGSSWQQPQDTGATGATSSSGQRGGGGGAGAGSGASSFPHAFERWETLSSHWEGLTSYWLRKLEQNYEEIKDSVPNAVTLNRQITDLSAAGANLFHAVVELQRLRASSERKFQRWFFETRAENERNREIQAQVENQLKVERAGREDAARIRAEAAITAENSRREVAEMSREMAEIRRELVISKDEARRAWEELGRRNQEALEIQESLQMGNVTKVGRVDVRPVSIGGGGGGGGGGESRPGTRDDGGGGGGGQYYGGADVRQYYSQQQQQQQQEGSPTNTDPFTETATPSQGQRYESMRPAVYQPQQQQQPSSGSRTITAEGSSRAAYPEQRPPPASAGSLGPSSSSRTQTASNLPTVSAQEAQRFYQHPPQETFLHSAHSSTSGGIAPQQQHQHQQQQQTPTARETLLSPSSQQSYRSEATGATEYVLDPQGNIRRDDTGQPITFRRLASPTGPEEFDPEDDLPEPEQRDEQEIDDGEDDDDYDTAADIRREAELSARFAGVVAPEAPGSSAAAMASAAATAGRRGGGGGAEDDDDEPDYEGEGFGDWSGLQLQQREQLQLIQQQQQAGGGRHHHPTRLSDVREEEEESSSRRTGD